MDTPTLELRTFTGTLAERSRAWADLNPDERKRRAAAAARDRDTAGLWSLTEAHLTTWGKRGARVSPHTLSAYRAGVTSYLGASSGVSLLNPPREWAPTWTRALEAAGASASTVRVRLAATRSLYAALRWSGATDADPFADVKAPKDPTPPWEKRQPYELEAVERLLAHAGTRDATLVLLGAHAGLRVSEACELTAADLDLAAGQLRVRLGKGGKQRTVALSRRLQAALATLELAPGASVLGVGVNGARAALRRLCKRAGVDYRAAHALRHSSGTRLYRDTGDLETVARHLGHANLETSRVYAKWSDERLRATVGGW